MNEIDENTVILDFVYDDIFNLNLLNLLYNANYPIKVAFYYINEKFTHLHTDLVDGHIIFSGYFQEINSEDNIEYLDYFNLQNNEYIDDIIYQLYNYFI